MTLPCVLHVIRPQPPGEVGGADLHIADLAEEQNRSGARAVVCHYGNPEYGALLDARGIENLGVPADGLRRWTRRLRAYVHDIGPTLVHSHGYDADYVATAVKLTAGPRAGAFPPYVISGHGFIRTGVRLRAMTLLNERCLRFADAIITAGAAEAARLRSLGHADVQYVANGVRPAPDSASSHLTDELPLPPEGPKVVYVGRLSPEKRPDLFLGAARTLTRERADVSFAVIGAGPLLTEYEKRSADLGLATRVHFTGLRRDVPALLAGADVLVCCSDTEGTPRAVVEGMAAGLPVVATRVGGLPDLVDDGTTGLLTDAGSESQLTDAVRSLLEAPEKAREMGAAGRLRAMENFGVARMWAEISEVYARATSATWPFAASHSR
ncbi:glycosyltransferase family 4 protein [Streptomyces sp. 130]|uniref:glycosyltransferase family 4 protein n=1 Tax=Streptomyces sp. 130 TaxID=2591006 RepID=UPI0021B0CC59|nr:glycosyltransferase family 4 protein [Streptomyces sp. 130]